MRCCDIIDSRDAGLDMIFGELPLVRGDAPSTALENLK